MKIEIIPIMDSHILRVQPQGWRFGNVIICKGLPAIREFADDLIAALIELECGQEKQECARCGGEYPPEAFLKVTHTKTCQMCRKKRRK